MAAILLSEIRGGLNQILQRARVLPTVQRHVIARSLATTTTDVPPTADESSVKTAPGTQSQPFDNSTYQVQEYFSYNEDSYYDLEVDIDSTGTRQKQPDPRKPYKHTEPWKKEAPE